ncbi:hypothetical protein K8352_18030 [Flavobacteriaceae bacterium F89]|uniref:Uncharacterized protein n=1 Tax=Cerina litoralis TaxID=2874477 RepID=A0AAE3EZU1_9FLAO|nr:hypothetical protein [Cerina litoralis]
MEKGVMQRVGRGIYKLGQQKEFVPLLSEDHKAIYGILKEKFPYLDVCIWSTKWLVPWMLHIPFIHETIIEVEKGAEESVFYFLSSERENVFLNPKKDILDKYTKDSKERIIIKNLITGSPLQNMDDIQIPALEKILVDLLVDIELLSAYQGRDLESIFENAFRYITINRDKLLRYAGRRGKKESVEEKIKEILQQ